MRKPQRSQRSRGREQEPKSGPDLRGMLAGGDRRSIGKADHVVTVVRLHPELVGPLVELLWDEDPLIAMRSADALEKATRGQESWLRSYKAQLIGLMAECGQQEVRWHLAVMVPRLQLSPAECGHVATVLQEYLKDRSSIVKTCAMQGLFDLTRQSPALRPEIRDLIRGLTRSGTAAMRARGRHLLKELESNDL